MTDDRQIAKACRKPTFTHSMESSAKNVSVYVCNVCFIVFKVFFVIVTSSIIQVVWTKHKHSTAL